MHEAAIQKKQHRQQGELADCKKPALDLHPNVAITASDTS